MNIKAVTIKAQKAFNLIEIMLVIAIFSALMALIMAGGKKAYNYYKLEQAVSFVSSSFDEISSYYKLSANTANIKEQVSEILKNVTGGKYSSIDVEYLGQTYVTNLETTIAKLRQHNEEALKSVASLANERVHNSSGNQMRQVVDVGDIFASNNERIADKKQEKISLTEATDLNRWVQTSGAAERYVFITSLGYVNFATQSLWRPNDSWSISFEKLSSEQCTGLIKQLSVRFFAISISGTAFLKDGKPVSNEVVEPSLIVQACEDAAKHSVDKYVQIDFLAPSFFSNTYNKALYGTNKGALMDPSAHVRLSDSAQGVQGVRSINNVTKERIDSLEALGAGGAPESILSDPCGGWKDEKEEQSAPPGCRKIKDETPIIRFK